MVTVTRIGNPKKWLKFVLFALFFVMFQVQTLTKSEIFDKDTTFHEILINGEWTEFRATYSLKAPAGPSISNWSCKSNVTSSKEENYWDFQLFFTSGSVKRSTTDWNLVRKESFLEPDGTNIVIPCIENVTLPLESQILQTYKRTGGKKLLVNDTFYPFDKYQFDVNFTVPSPISYKAKITLPENTVPVPNSSYISYFERRQKQTSTITTQRGTADEFAYQVEIIVPPENIISGAYSFFEGPRSSLIYSLRKISAGQQISIVAQWERPPLVKFLFVASFISILILTLSLICSREFKTSDYLAHSFTIFALQEGINQLVIPAGRPLTITLFELPIIIVFFAVLYRHIQIKRVIMLRERMSEESIRTPLVSRAYMCVKLWCERMLVK